MKNTPNYKLPQFEVDDNFSISDFNEAFSTIDTSISDLQETFNINGTQGDLIVNEVVQARKGESNLKNKIDKIDESLNTISSSLEDIENKMFAKIYLKDYGILPNTDITQKIIDLFKVIPDNSCIEFEENEIYLITQGGILLNGKNISLNGNNSTLKLANNSGYIEKIKDTDISRNIITIVGDNISVNNLLFDGNINNNFFIYNNETYYAYHPDLNISGIPNKQIFYNVLNFVGNGLHLEGLNFTNVAGGSINIGNTSTQLTTNVEIYNCAFSKNFRAAVAFFNSKYTKVENCRFYHNQRHSIQFYTMNSYGKAIDNRILNTVSEMPKWYPTWTISNKDAETIGVSLGHGEYNDFNGFFEIENNTIDYSGEQGIKNGIAIRNYVKNVDIINNTITARWQGIFINKGINGINNIKENTFNKQCENGIRLDFGVGNPNIQPTAVIANLNIENNYIGGIYSIIFENCNDESVKASYKKLNININNNNFYNNIYNFSGITNLIENTNTPIVDIVLNNNSIDGISNKNYLNAYLLSKLITIRNKTNTKIPNNYSASGLIKVAKIVLKANSFANINGEFKSYGNVDNPFSSKFSILIKSTSIESNPTVKMTVEYKSSIIATDFIRVILSEKTSDEMTFFLYLKHGDYSITSFENELGNKGVVTFIGNRRTYTSYDETLLLEFKSV